MSKKYKIIFDTSISEVVSEVYAYVINTKLSMMKLFPLIHPRHSDHLLCHNYLYLNNIQNDWIILLNIHKHSRHIVYLKRDFQFIILKISVSDNIWF